RYLDLSLSIAKYPLHQIIGFISPRFSFRIIISRGYSGSETGNQLCDDLPGRLKTAERGFGEAL
ncbi:MAG: hypothetical protein WCF59_09340, partial [Desulfobaccales bacterium]